MAEVTIVFADLTGSTGLYEHLGNAKAVDIVTRATHWIGEVCERYGGRVVKYLGDGVLASFMPNTSAVEAMIEMQRLHTERIRNLPENLKIKIKVGLARGEVVEQDGDCFGDAVNLAARLSDLAGPDQILAAEAVIDQIAPGLEVRHRSLGPMNIRGRAEPAVVCRIEWQRELASEFLTLQAALESVASNVALSLPQGIRLEWMGAKAEFTAADLPIFLGRVSEAQFVVNDQRVSRLHARIDRRGDQFTLEDVSSFGTWVRFGLSSASLALRREGCVLMGNGEIALGASFDDATVPAVRFNLVSPAYGDTLPQPLA